MITPPQTHIFIATRNVHKAGEIRGILGEQFEYLTPKDFAGVSEVVEDADSFTGNASKKAMELAKWLVTAANVPPIFYASRIFVIADDSGLEVDCLNGVPGVHSARFAALDTGKYGNSTDAENNAKLLRLLKGVPMENRAARFRCVIALVEIRPPSSILCPEIFDGLCEGHIDFAPAGQAGFGYDPIFVPSGFTQSFAELTEKVKNQLSHRAKALAKLRLKLASSSAL